MEAAGKDPPCPVSFSLFVAFGLFLSRTMPQLFHRAGLYAIALVYVCVHKTISYETLEHLIHENNTASQGEKNERNKKPSSNKIRIAEQFGLTRHFGKANL